MIDIDKYYPRDDETFLDQRYFTSLIDMFHLRIKKLEAFEASYGLIVGDTVNELNQLLTELENIIEENNLVEINNNINQLQADLIQAELDIVSNQAAIALKANQTDMTQAQSDITANQAAIALKASQTDMTQAQTDITANQAAIALKANQTDMTQAQSDITANQAAIALKANQTDMTQAQTDINNLKNGTTLPKRKIAQFEHRENNGVDGGGTTGGVWNSLTVNTTVFNTIPGATLGSNRITLTAGKYHLRMSQSVNNTGHSRLQVRNASLVEVIHYGVEHTPGATGEDNGDVSLETFFQLTSTNQIDFLLWANNSRSNDGLGSATSSGTHETYCCIIIEKMDW